MLYGCQTSVLTIRGWGKIVGWSDDNRWKIGGPMKFLIGFVGVWVYTRSIVSPEVFVYTGAVIQWVGEVWALGQASLASLGVHYRTP